MLMPAAITPSPHPDGTYMKSSITAAALFAALAGTAYAQVSVTTDVTIGHTSAERHQGFDGTIQTCLHDQGRGAYSNGVAYGVLAVAQGKKDTCPPEIVIGQIVEITRRRANEHPETWHLSWPKAVLGRAQGDLAVPCADH
jgi:hypothetical protein